MVLDGEDAQILSKVVPKQLLAFDISGEKRRAGFNISGENSRPVANGTHAVAIMAKRMSRQCLMVRERRVLCHSLILCLMACGAGVGECCATPNTATELFGD
jgi:hypothetical protein